MKILITGASGFIGKYLVERFKKLNYEVISVTRTKVESLYLENGMILDNLGSVEELIAEIKPNMCIHCAGASSVQLSLENPYVDFNDNVLTTRNLLEAIRIHSPLTKLIYLSSAAVYGDPKQFPINEYSECSPISPYGYNKLIAENLINQYKSIYGIDSAILRIFSVYGNGLRKQVIHDTFEKFLNDNLQEVKLFGTGEETRDFIHVSDIFEIINLVLEKKLNGVYNVGSGTSISIEELAYLIKQELNSQKEILFEGAARSGDPLKWTVDIKPIKEQGFTPKKKIKDGLKEYHEWLRYNKE